MRILYIADGGPGGISSHVRCLTQCLKGVADVMVCITQKTDALRQMLEEDGTPYYLCNCTSGHDPRLVFAMRRVVKTFKPDVIHLHDYRLFGALYLRWFTKIPRVCSIHLPSNPHPRFSRRLVNWAVQPCYWLPVSKANWERFRTYHPGVRGEVFFNPVRIGGGEVEKVGGGGEWKGSTFTVGMVGRNADQKDWPAFHEVERIVKSKGESGEKKVVVESGSGTRADREVVVESGSGTVEFGNPAISRRLLAEKKVDEWLRGVTRESFVSALGKLVEEKTAVGEYGNDLSRCWAEYAFHNLAEVKVLLMNARKNTPPLKLLSEVVESVERHQGAGYLPSTSVDNIPNSVVPGPPKKSNNPKSNNQTIPSVEFLNAGEHSVCDGLAAIRKMDLFLMTSKHEELPTVVLECFLLGTPVCGFIPRGGMHDILEFSKGPLREVFIEERDCGKLADIVLDLMAHPEKRQALVEDGRQILEGHFDAEKNCKGQLMEIYKNCLIV